MTESTLLLGIKLCHTCGLYLCLICEADLATSVTPIDCHCFPYIDYGYYGLPGLVKRASTKLHQTPNLQIIIVDNERHIKFHAIDYREKSLNLRASHEVVSLGIWTLPSFFIFIRIINYADFIKAYR